jgi:alkylated DNA repair dioxygenase AlkB
MSPITSGGQKINGRMANKAQISPPYGFRYQTDILPADKEQVLVEHIRELPLKEYEVHGFAAKRRVIYYGWQYDSGESRLKQIGAMPTYLLPIHECAAAFAGLPVDDLALAQVIEYAPGAAIGWHRDRAVFGDIIGISLLAPCKFRFRRKNGPTWERYSPTADPRSIYLLRGAALNEWQHSIPAVDALRYSIIFRSLRATEESSFT